MSKRVQYIFALLTGIVLELVLYITLHETGHCIVAWICGSTVTSFRVIGASMSFIGGSYNRTSESLLHLSGMLLPVLLVILYLLCYQKSWKNIFYRVYSMFFVMAGICSILAWVMVPVLYLIQEAPENDDVTKFLQSSGCSPIVVIIVAALMFLGLLRLAQKKRVITNFSECALGGEEN